VIYICVWAERDEQSFEAGVPVQWHGEYLKKHSWNNNIVLVFMEGINLLSKDYVDKLQLLGYEIIDAEPVLHKIENTIPNIKSTRKYIKNTFLRWHVLHQIYQKNNKDGDTLIHVDGDLIFNVNPSEIQKDLEGRTIVVSTATVAVSCNKWFETWEKEVEEFSSDRIKYIKKTFELRAAMPKRHDLYGFHQQLFIPYGIPSTEMNNKAWYDQWIVHNWYQEQDMMDTLLYANIMPDDNLIEFARSTRFFWDHLQLFPQLAGTDLNFSRDSLVYVDKGEHHFVGSKPVAYSHFQNDLSRWCEAYVLCSEDGFENFARDAFWKDGENFMPIKGRLIGQMCRTLYNRGNIMTRRDVCDAVFSKNPRTGNQYIVDIKNWLVKNFKA